jgi:ketopantoate reductase
MPPSSRIAFVGAGALGQALAVHVGAVTPVTLVATPRSFTKILQPGRIRLSGLSDRSIAVVAGAAEQPGTVGVVQQAGDVPDDDNLVFVTKGPQLADAIAGFRGRAGTGWVAGLQNGERAGDACRLFTSAGLRAAVADDLESLLWTKCANAIGIFGVTALARVSTTEMFQTPALVSAYLSLLAETQRVAQACGVTIRDFEDLPMGRYLSAPAGAIGPEIVRAARARADGARSVSSMAQDVMAGRPTEAAETFGDVARRAGRHGVAVPLIGLVAEIIGGLDDLASGPAQTG